MLWNKKTIIIGFGILCSVFVSVLSSCASYAIADISLTIDNTNYNSGTNLCGSDCSSYHYLLVEDFSNTGFVYYFRPYSSDSFARLNISYNAGLSGNLQFMLFYFDNADQFIGSASNWSSTVSFKITLSENNPFGSAPTGNLNISENGIFDVSSYATATVNVPPTVIAGDYHDDLVSINNSILVCAAVCLVIYFFYCIYRMIIKGVK